MYYDCIEFFGGLAFTVITIVLITRYHKSESYLEAKRLKEKQRQLEKHDKFVQKESNKISSSYTHLNALCKGELLYGLNANGRHINASVIYNNFEDKLSINLGGALYTIPYERVLNIECCTKQDIQKQYVSSCGGAIVGAMLFGCVGALIGGRVKQKDIVNTNDYLVITYLTKDFKTEYISIALNSNQCRYVINTYLNNLRNHNILKQTKSVSIPVVEM